MPARRVAKPRAKAKSTAALALTGELGLAHLESLHSLLMPLRTRAAPVALDASGITKIDAAGLQLLAGFVRERQSKGRAVVWHGVPTWLAEAAQQLGLTAALAVARA